VEKFAGISGNYDGLDTLPDGDFLPAYRTVEDFRMLMRTGRRPDGSAVDKTMPISVLKNMNDTDLDALYASKEAGSYPLMLATYEIVCSTGYDADTAAAVKSFLTVAANEGQANLSAAGYVPLPDAFKERLLKSVDAIA